MFFSVFDTMFPIFFSTVFIIIVGMFIFMAVSGITTWTKNNNSPRLIVDAIVVAKRENVSHHHHNNGGDISGAHGSYMTVDTTYYVTFEVESGDRIEFSVNGSEYGQLAEGDQGKLSFQGSRYLGFERFY